MIVNFVFQKLKSKYTSLKKYKLRHLVCLSLSIFNKRKYFSYISGLWRNRIIPFFFLDITQRQKCKVKDTNKDMQSSYLFFGWIPLCIEKLSNIWNPMHVWCGHCTALGLGIKTHGPHFLLPWKDGPFIAHHILENFVF